MGKDHWKKAKKEAADLDPHERELFLNAFYQYDVPEKEYEPGTPDDTWQKPQKPVATPIDEDERELFLNALNQGVSRAKVVEYDNSTKSRRALPRPKKKGQIDSTLDLHGMYAKDAVDALLRFIRDKKAKGAKTVLIIHGKGAGVLKEAVWSIIKTHPDIFDFQQAPARHGGEGAIIVRLGRLFAARVSL